MKQKIKSIVYEYSGLAVGSSIMSLGLVLFLIPAKIAPSGMSGIGIVLHHLFNLPVGLIMLLFNIPLFILGLKILGKQFGPRTFFSFIFVSLTTNFF